MALVADPALSAIDIGSATGVFVQIYGHIIVIKLINCHFKLYPLLEILEFISSVFIILFIL